MELNFWDKIRSIPASEKASRIMSIFLLVTFVFSIFFAIYNIATTPEATSGTEHERSDYVLMLLQCCLGVVVIALPNILEKRFSFYIPNFMYIMYFMFLYCAIYLGEVQSFYSVIPHWDTILHAFSGAMLGAFGFSLVAVLNSADNVPLKTSPIFVAIFAFTFALSVGVIWEVYEYLADGILGTNMQKFETYGGDVLVGHDALSDTMKDLITDALSALGVSIIGFLQYRKKAAYYPLPKPVVKNVK